MQSVHLCHTGKRIGKLWLYSEWAVGEGGKSRGDSLTPFFRVAQQRARAAKRSSKSFAYLTYPPTACRDIQGSWYYPDWPQLREQLWVLHTNPSDQVWYSWHWGQTALVALSATPVFILAEPEVNQALAFGGISVNLGPYWVSKFVSGYRVG